MFQTHVDLLQSFLARRAPIVACIEQILNCQKKPEYWQDFALLTRHFEACFPAGANAAQHVPRDELEQAHWNSGFKPRAQPGNALVDPVEQMLRAFHMWRATRWPGQNGRVHFAHTLFNLYIVRTLALLGMRLWDDDDAGVPVRLQQLQSVLDTLWTTSPADQPRLVKDVRWLFPVAMSPTTDSIAGYFTIAERIASTFTAADRLETQKAWVVTGAGHLRSQLRDLVRRRNVGLDDPELILLTRVSNALDVALLMAGLVTLFDGYERARQDGDAEQRRALACAICQGLSPDPELFVNRVDLLGPYTMIEHLFVATDADGRAVYTPAGERHLALLAQYRDALVRLAPALYEDCKQLAPPAGAWSPYGALYGFASNLLELIAFKTLTREAMSEFGMEDVFSAGDGAKLAWVNGWRQLPHINPEVARQFEFPREFAEAIHARVEQALQLRATGGSGHESGRLFIVADDDMPGAGDVPELPQHYVVASDPQLVAAGKAEAKDLADLLHCRNEGEFLVSYATPAGWVALTKDLLTDLPGAGKDARIEVPRAAAQILRLMCLDLAAR